MDDFELNQFVTDINWASLESGQTFIPNDTSQFSSVEMLMHLLILSLRDSASIIADLCANQSAVGFIFSSNYFETAQNINRPQ